MKPQWKLVTCHCQHTTNLNGAWRGQSCKHHFGHLFNTTLKHSSLSSSCYFPSVIGWDVGSGWTCRLDRTRLCWAVVELGACPAPCNPHQGHQAHWEMVWLGSAPRARQTGCWGEKELVAQRENTLGEYRKAVWECVLCVFLLGTFLQQCLQLQWLKHHS